MIDAAKRRAGETWPVLTLLTVEAPTWVRGREEGVPWEQSTELIESALKFRVAEFPCVQEKVGQCERDA